MWMKLDDKFHDHPKVHRLLEAEHLDALGLWLVAGSWCGDQLSDGLISGYVLGRFSADWRRLADVLVEAGLWDREDVDGRVHFRFHHWLDYNDSREKVEADREAARIRQALYRDKELVAAITKRDQDRCRYCGTRVQWNDKRGGGGGTYDHVKPIADGGRNTLDNVVTCCRRCNGFKGKRTLRDAGMRLLKPRSLGAPVVDDRPGDGGVDNRVGSGRVGARNVLGDTPSTADPTSDPETDSSDDDLAHADLEGDDQ